MTGCALEFEQTAATEVREGGGFQRGGSLPQYWHSARTNLAHAPLREAVGHTTYASKAMSSRKVLSPDGHDQRVTPDVRAPLFRGRCRFEDLHWLMNGKWRRQNTDASSANFVDVLAGRIAG